MKGKQSKLTYEKKMMRKIMKNKGGSSLVHHVVVVYLSLAVFSFVFLVSKLPLSALVVLTETLGSKR
jgi:hypothetical protein